MILHENCLPADDSHEISCLICYFWKSGKIWKCRLLQIIGDAVMLYGLSINTVTQILVPYCIVLDKVSQRNNSKIINAKVIVLTLCTSTNLNWCLYGFSWWYLKLFASWRANMVLWQTDRQTGNQCLPTLKRGRSHKSASIQLVHW